MSVTLKQLQYFVAAAENLSTTAAGEALHVSQPSISAAIGQLEASLGGRLFLRHQGVGLTLTPMGGRALKQAREILVRVDDFDAGLPGESKDLTGEVRLACFVDLAPHYVPGLQAAVRKHHPGIAIELHEGDFEEVGAGLRQGLADVAITYRLALSAELQDEVLIRLPVFAMVPAGHLLANQTSVSLAQLAKEPLILTRSPYSETHFMSVFYNAGLEPRRGAVTESFELQRGLVANGFGVALSYTRPAARRSYDGRRLVYRPLADAIPEQPIVLVRHREFPLSGVTQAVMAVARDYFSGLKRH